MTNPSLRGVPPGRDDEAIYIFTKKVGLYKRWDCFASLAMTTYKGTNYFMNSWEMILVFCNNKTPSGILPEGVEEEK
jgi:hypothetical protein